MLSLGKPKKAKKVEHHPVIAVHPHGHAVAYHHHPVAYHHHPVGVEPYVVPPTAVAFNGPDNSNEVADKLIK